MRALFGAVGSLFVGHLFPKYTQLVVMIGGLFVLAVSSITMSFAPPTMPVWLLTLAYDLVALGNATTQTSSSDVILGAAPPDRVRAVSAMKPAAGMTGYTLGPTIFVLMLNVFFSRTWFADAEARELSDQQARHALDVVTQAATGSSPVVPYDPYLVQQAVEIARGLLQRSDDNHADHHHRPARRCRARVLLDPTSHRFAQ
jgi:MFS transporter, DHA2 family, multidrug resistance protein